MNEIKINGIVYTRFINSIDIIYDLKSRDVVSTSSNSGNPLYNMVMELLAKLDLSGIPTFTVPTSGIYQVSWSTYHTKIRKIK